MNILYVLYNWVAVLALQKCVSGQIMVVLLGISMMS